MEQKEIEKEEMVLARLRKLTDQALTHLLVLKTEPNDRIALLGLLHAMQGVKVGADMLSIKGVFDYAGEAERLLSILVEGKITITEEIVSCVYDSVETLSKMISNW
ncbi:MAG: chemotaxis protein histidine kinase CheA [Chlamydiales bacterium]|jgi:chemotaxis protein histidine kinase CheA